MPLTFEDLISNKNPSPGQAVSNDFSDLVPQQTSEPSVVGDVLKSAGSGLARGAADLVGLPGTISDAFNNGMSYITGLPQLPQSPLSGNTLRGAASAVTGGATDYQPQTTAGEYASTAGEFVPGAMAFGGGTLGSAVRYGVVPGLASEGAGQLTEGTGYEPYARVAAALVAPVAVGAAGRAITPFPASEARLAQADILANEGVDLTAAQRTGSKSLGYRESELGGPAAADFMERQGEQFTRAALQRAGINADRATPEVMAEGRRAIGQKFDDLASRNNIIPDPQLRQDVVSSVNNYNSGVAESFRAPIVNEIANDIRQQATAGPISGTWYQRTASRIAERARSTSDPDLRNALYDLRGDLDDAMERSIAATNPNDLGGWQQARSQYRNYLTLENAATGAGENAAMGLISPQKLRQATVQTQGRRNYVEGRGDFDELARAGNATMTPLPNSGTASRINARNLGGGALSLLGAGGGASLGGTYGAVAGALAGAALPSAVGQAILSRPGRAYLSNQLLGRTNLADRRTLSVIEALLSQGQSPQKAGQ